ncbi:MAG: antitoxin [Planctomycetota bacterium]|jgi:antitoxin ChpS|nr:antitoxin [Planctomycetota bacterium]
MYTTNLRQINGATMLEIPATMVTAACLALGKPVNIAVARDLITIAPPKRPRYTLTELLAQCAAGPKFSAEENEWLSSPASGTEQI